MNQLERTQGDMTADAVNITSGREQVGLGPGMAEVVAGGGEARAGRSDNHTEHLGLILAEMQFLQRAYPGQEW